MDGIYQVVVGGHNGRGQYAENVFNFKIAGTSAMDYFVTCTNILSNFITNVMPQLQAIAGSDVILDVFYVRKIDGTGGAAVWSSGVFNGMSAQESFSNALAAECVFYPGGANNRLGRIYLWGLDVLSVIADTLQAGVIALIQALITNLLVGFAVGAGTATYGTWSKKTATFTPAVHGQVKPKLAGMTKRTLPLG
jgi:hypothetical protein